MSNFNFVILKLRNAKQTIHTMLALSNIRNLSYRKNILYIFNAASSKESSKMCTSNRGNVKRGSTLGIKPVKRKSMVCSVTKQRDARYKKKVMTEFEKKKKREKKRKEKRLGSDRRANERARSLSKPPFVATNTIVGSRHHPPRSRVKGHDEEERRTLFLLFFLLLPPPLFLFYVARGLRAAWREHTRENEVHDDENDGNDNGQREEKRAWPDKETNF